GGSKGPVRYDDVCYIVSGLFESWVEKLVAALYNREKDANVIVVDWLDIQMYLYSTFHNDIYMFPHHLPQFFLNISKICGKRMHTCTWGHWLLNLGCDIVTFFPLNNAIRCEHERSVHLFIDSLLNEEEASRAYSCGSNDMFDRGMCLQCHKNRCNTVGYDASKVRKARSVKMFIKTRGSMPFRVFHYQLKINFLGKLNQLAMEPALTVSLYGTNGEAEALKLNVQEKITANKTYSFLVVTEKDSGDLLMLKFKLEESTSSLLSLHSSWWYGDSANSGVQVHKIRVRAGETQNKYVSNIFTRYSEHKKLSYTSNSHF
uniref:triacylglycerol lipase n=1 Tax=Sinocyclocheilus anshuiensis TaxID=1608454 RepID=A0A671SSK2_9TELE